MGKGVQNEKFWYNYLLLLNNTYSRTPFYFSSDQIIYSIESSLLMRI